MRLPFIQNEPTPYDGEIERLMDCMNAIEPESPEYKQMLKHCERLTKMKTTTRRKKVSTDALVSAGASVLGILIIVAYEHAHVVTSKGLGFVPKT